MGGERRERRKYLKIMTQEAGRGSHAWADAVALEVTMSEHRRGVSS